MDVALKILCIGDPHFKVDNKAETDALAEEVGKIIRSGKIGIVVILGDILDTHSKISMEVQCRAVRFIQDVSEAMGDKHVYVLIGNHDIPHNACMPPHEYHSLPGLDSQHVHVINRPTLVEFGLNIVLTPYVPVGRFEEALDTVEGWKDADIVFAHQELHGCKYGRNKVEGSKSGDVWRSDYPYLVSGHIHDRDETLAKNILYVGAPFQHRFGDSEDTGLTTITLSKGILSTKPAYITKAGFYVYQTLTHLGSINLKRTAIIQSSYVGKFTTEPNIRYWIRIICTQTTDLEKHANIIKWRSDGHRVTYEVKDYRPTKIESVKPIPFVERLRCVSPDGIDELCDEVLTIF